MGPDMLPTTASPMGLHLAGKPTILSPLIICTGRTVIEQRMDQLPRRAWEGFFININPPQSPLVRGEMSHIRGLM